MSRTANCLILSLLILGAQAFAGQDNDKCQQSSKQNATDCQDTAGAANAANNADAGNFGNTAGNAVQPNSVGMAGITQAAKNRLDQANQRCAQDKQKCESDCDQAKQSADQKVASGQAKDQCKSSPCPEAKSDQSQIPQTKQSQCTGAILPMMMQLGSGSGGNQAGNQGANQTAAQSVGNGTTSPNGNCTPSNPNAATDANCTQTLIAQCGPGGALVNAPNSPCAKFTANYCTAQPKTQFPTETPPAGSVIPGSGVGSAYCNTNGDSNGTTLGSTTGSGTTTTGSGDTNLPSTSLGTGDTATGTGGTGGSSGAGGDGDTNRPSTSSASLDAAKEGLAKAAASSLPKVNMATSEGGGGGGSSALDEYGGAHDYSLGKFAGFATDQKKNPAAILGASRAPASTDVAAVNSPSLFNISSAAIQNMCSHNKLKHCGKN